jgi:hypothetical protein
MSQLSKGDTSMDEQANERPIPIELVDWVRLNPDVAAYELTKLRRRVALLDKLVELSNP